jgi:hypothetical protein
LHFYSTKDIDATYHSSVAKVEMIEVGGERREEDTESYDESADDGRQPGRLPAAEERRQRRQGQGQAERKRRQATCKATETRFSGIDFINSISAEMFLDKKINPRIRYR